jgi:hypothetical protein
MKKVKGVGKKFLNKARNKLKNMGSKAKGFFNKMVGHAQLPRSRRHNA